MQSSYIILTSTSNKIPVSQTGINEANKINMDKERKKKG